MSAQVDVLDTMHDCAMRLRSKKCDLFAADLDEARAAVAALIAERDALREALDWYAKQAELCRKLGGLGDAGRHALDADGGKRARAALALTTGESA